MIVFDCVSFRSWLTWALFDPVPFHCAISVDCVAVWVDPVTASICCVTEALFTPVVFSW